MTNVIESVQSLVMCATPYSAELCLMSVTQRRQSEKLHITNFRDRFLPPHGRTEFETRPSGRKPKIKKIRLRWFGHLAHGLAKQAAYWETKTVKTKLGR